MRSIAVIMLLGALVQGGNSVETTNKAMKNVIAWDAPEGEKPSPDYGLSVNGVPVFVYQAPVRTEIWKKGGLWSHHPGAPSQMGSFAIFDMSAPVEVAVKPTAAFTSVQVLPKRAGISASISDGIARFRLDKPQHLTLIFDGSDRRAFHLFIGAPEKNPPKEGDANVVYFGPGVHEVTQLAVKSGQTVYIAGGAVVKGVLAPDEKPVHNEDLEVDCYPGTVIGVDKVENVRICGRGIIDSSAIPHPGRASIYLSGSSDVQVEGITIRDAANWNVTVNHSQHVKVTDVRIISGRLNSDGINSVNAQDVQIRGCFVRNHDDSIVCKCSKPGEPACENIDVRDCQMWCDWGYAMGVTYESRAPLRKISYRDCSVFYARNACMGVRLSDSALASEISFTDIEVDPNGSTPWLFHGLIKRDSWGHDAESGHIKGVRLENVTVNGDEMLKSDLEGHDAEHQIESVTFKNVRHGAGKPAKSAEELRITTNQFVKGMTVEP